MATYKTHVALREADGTLRTETACGRSVWNCDTMTVKLNDMDRVDWCAWDTLAVVNSGFACKTCVAVLRSLSE